MKGTIKLHTPVMIDGKNRNELTYDTDMISVAMFAEANGHALMGSRSTFTGVNPKLDYTLQLYLGFEAVIAVNDDIELINLEKGIRGRDLNQFIEIGQNFTLSVDGSTSEDSEEPLETTAEPSTLPSQNYDE